MENNENGFVPENQQPVYQPAPQEPVYQQPVAQPEAPQKDIGAMVNQGIDKVKSFAQSVDVEGIKSKGLSLLDKIKALPKKVWIGIGAGILAVIALFVILSLTGVTAPMGNTYKTPFAAAERLLNSKSLSQVMDRAPSVLNGFGESEAKKLIDLVKKSEQYKDNKDDIEESFEEAIEGIKEQYGDDYKIKIKVTDKEKLDKDDCKDFKDSLKTIGKSLEDIAEEAEDMDSDDLADAAEELGISKNQLKDGIKLIKSFAKQCKNAKVSAGYEVEIVVSIDGKELDEPEEEEMTVNVYKVNGNWVPDPFSALSGLGLNINSLMRMLG